MGRKKCQRCIQKVVEFEVLSSIPKIFPFQSLKYSSHIRVKTNIILKFRASRCCCYFSHYYEIFIFIVFISSLSTKDFDFCSTLSHLQSYIHMYMCKFFFANLLYFVFFYYYFLFISFSLHYFCFSGETIRKKLPLNFNQCA